jgi:6-pyruvoyltetrahydropterin/6-carboxytetrahydropterin synthase
MIIRKLFKFENAHIVRGCSTLRCRSSLHGHSYKVEVLLESNFLDNAQMVYDFGLMKQNMRDVIDSFDHCVTLWSKDSKEYIEDMKKHSARWVEIPVSPSAEQFSRLFFVLLDRLFSLTTTINGERDVKLHSIIVHETDTGYAQAFRDDAYSKNMGLIEIDDISLSDDVKNGCTDKELWDKIKNKESFLNPDTI